jgi:hypothetical protein
MYESGKMRPVETIPRTGGGEIKENDGGREFNCDTLQELKASMSCPFHFPSCALNTLFQSK